MSVTATSLRYEIMDFENRYMQEVGKPIAKDKMRIFISKPDWHDVLASMTPVDLAFRPYTLDHTEFLGIKIVWLCPEQQHYLAVIDLIPF